VRSSRHRTIATRPAGDPPIDWAKVETAEEWWAFMKNRDEHYASVAENAVLGRGRRCLLLIGGMHLIRTPRSLLGARFRSMRVIIRIRSPDTGKR
jgi:hypothetical protein